jgi:hypothetical protein
MAATNQRFSEFWDKLGIGLSVICLLHCLLLPVVILSLPIMMRFYLGNPLIHLGLALLVVPVGFISFIRGYRHHRKALPLVLGGLGIALISLTPFLVHVLKFGLPENGILISGSVILITAHLQNRKFCQQCPLKG